MQLGAEFNPQAEEVGPLATFFVLTEAEQRPAFYLGTSSDRIGSPPGLQSYYVTASKYISSLRTSFFGSVNYSEWDEGVNFPFGLTVELGKGFSARHMYDGNRSHLLLNYFADQYSFSIVYIWLKTPGVSFSFGF